MNSEFRNWSDLRAFLAVFRSGSTLAASKSLGMAQPTVARRIDALEHELGLTLFLRDTRGFRPTPAAEALMPLAEQVETDIRVFADASGIQTKKSAGAIRINSAPSTFTEDFAEIVVAFKEIHPNVSFEFNSSVHHVDLGAGEADIAIRYAAEIEDPQPICRKLFTTHSSIYGSEKYAAVFGLPDAVDGLAGHKFILGDKDLFGVTHRWLEARLTADQVVMRCSDFDTMVASIASGFGLGALGAGIARGNKKLIRCFELPLDGQIGAWLVINPDAHRRAEVKAFTAFFAPRYSAFLEDQWEKTNAVELEKTQRYARYF
jgi:DNA-binding transcriptional LysR family regulator